MAQTFSAQIGDWVRRTKGAQEAIFKQSAQRLVNELNAELTRLVYSDPATDHQRTGFLRASLTASTTAMPTLSRPNPGGSYGPDNQEAILVIEGADITDQIFIGYTAQYAAYVHHGAQGRPARPWVDLVSQRWPQIVSEEAAKAKRAFGL